jgi:hypothetical protein
MWYKRREGGRQGHGPCTRMIIVGLIALPDDLAVVDDLDCVAVFADGIACAAAIAAVSTAAVDITINDQPQLGVLWPFARPINGLAQSHHVRSDVRCRLKGKTFPGLMNCLPSKNTLIDDRIPNDSLIGLVYDGETHHCSL